MRLAKVDATTAQKYAEKAAAGGTLARLMTMLILMYDNANGYANPNTAH